MAMHIGLEVAQRSFNSRLSHSKDTEKIILDVNCGVNFYRQLENGWDGWLLNPDLQQPVFGTLSSRLSSNQPEEARGIKGATDCIA